MALPAIRNGFRALTDPLVFAFPSKVPLEISPHGSGSDSQTLCETCNALDLRLSKFCAPLPKAGASVGPAPATVQEIIKLGYIDEMEIIAATCPFCRLVVRFSQDLKFKLPDHEGRVQAGVRWQSWELGKYSASHLALYLGVNIFIPVGKVRLLADDAPARLAFGRFVRPKVDLRLLRCWMRNCDRWHSTACDSLVNTTSYRPWDSGSFRLIDVHKQCLVRRRTACRYIALSYVWGGTESISTLRTNVLQLEQPRAFASRSVKLPRTILDAIHLVEELGEKYLWIDRLCIVQDDAETKLQEINNMDKIYGNAFLAIIATGDDAESGLPGLHTERSDTIQAIEEISPGFRLVLGVEWELEIQATKYQSRAWTYQERTAAPRRLYFLNRRIVFECNWASWMEDYVLEDKIVGSSSRLSGWPEEYSNFATATYMKDIYMMLSEYTRRDITFDSDTLLAFVGIGNILSLFHGTQLCYGLPVAFFDRLILWRSVQGPRRRRKHFPTWCWAEFEGVKTFPHHAQSNGEFWDWMRLETWIKWSLLEENGLKGLFTTTDAENSHDDNLNSLLDQEVGVRTEEHPIWKEFAATPDASAMLSNHPTENEPPPVHHFFNELMPSLRVSPFDYNKLSPTAFQGHGLLHFWTFSLQYKLAPSDDANVMLGSAIRLLGSDDVPAGFLYHLDDEQSCNQALPATGEVVLLSGSNFTPVTDKVAQDMKIAPQLETQPSDWQKANTAFNIMMVTQASSGIYERFGLGFIAKGAMKEGLKPPEWKEVVLG